MARLHPFTHSHALPLQCISVVLLLASLQLALAQGEDCEPALNTLFPSVTGKDYVVFSPITCKPLLAGTNEGLQIGGVSPERRERPLLGGKDLPANLRFYCSGQDTSRHKDAGTALAADFKEVYLGDYLLKATKADKASALWAWNKGTRRRVLQRLPDWDSIRDA